MPRIPGTTNRQSAFLRSFRLDPNPPPPSWPSRAILDRWLRRPAFRIAYDQIRESQRTARALFTFGLPTTEYREPRHPRPRTVSGRPPADHLPLRRAPRTPPLAHVANNEFMEGGLGI